METFLHALRIQRWDDHRYYHQSRINQSLHFISAISFLVAYGWLLIDPAVSALIGWGVAMVTRQSGHFFFEPKGYDHINHASHDYKEEIKVGYNLNRKVVLMAIWVAAPLLLWAQPGLWGWVEPATSAAAFWHQVGWAWLALGVAGLVFRVLQLAVLRDPMTGLVWATKILTDPFHDLWLYRKAPLALLRGEWLDPMHHARQG